MAAEVGPGVAPSPPRRASAARRAASQRAQRAQRAQPAQGRAQPLRHATLREALRKRRCLIPATGFYEWEHRGRTKRPWLFRRRDEQPFAFAGLWERWRAPDGATRETCAIITTAPNDLMLSIHDRFPVMLRSENFGLWLDPAVAEPAALAPLLRAPPSEAVSATALSRYVSNVRHEGPECLRPMGDDDDEDDNQFSLGLD